MDKDANAQAYQPMLGDPILDAAARSFSQYGWNATTVERVAADARVALKEVVRKYPSREHLAVAILGRVLDRLPDEFADEIQPQSSLRDRLYTITAHALRLLEPQKPFMRAVLQQTMNPLSMMGPMQLPDIARVTAFVREQISIARGRGEVSLWTVPSIAAGAWWVLHLRILSYWLGDLSPGSTQTHANADKWIGQFIRTLGGTAAETPSVRVPVAQPPQQQAPARRG